VSHICNFTINDSEAGSSTCLSLSHFRGSNGTSVSEPSHCSGNDSGVCKRDIYKNIKKVKMISDVEKIFISRIIKL